MRLPAGGGAVNSAEELARSVRERFGIPERPPVNVIRLVHDMGIPTEAVDGLECSGQLVVSHQDEPRILYASGQSDRRRQFTIAHELGHYLLADDGIDFDRQRTNRRIERFCDQFASDLLLPTAWLRDKYADGPVSASAMEDLARRAFVSRPHAVSALNHHLSRWDAGLLFWQWDRWDKHWQLMSRVLPIRFRKVLQPSANTQSWLASLRPNPRPEPCQAPFAVASRHREVRVEVFGGQTKIWLFIDLSQLERSRFNGASTETPRLLED